MSDFWGVVDAASWPAIAVGVLVGGTAVAVLVEELSVAFRGRGRKGRTEQEDSGHAEPGLDVYERAQTWAENRPELIVGAPSLESSRVAEKLVGRILGELHRIECKRVGDLSDADKRDWRRLKQVREWLRSGHTIQ